jgi:hypothetical protein
VLGLTGQQLLEALENGVSQYPKLEGRFPCVSGVKFEVRSRLRWCCGYTYAGGEFYPFESVTCAKLISP